MVDRRPGGNWIAQSALPFSVRHGSFGENTLQNRRNELADLPKRGRDSADHVDRHDGARAMGGLVAAQAGPTIIKWDQPDPESHTARYLEGP